ncbi:MAG: hypothetical protein GY862_16795 [Gammaproteobacteria bacterium]|nr:hypothetical protein [Gammaproteobacteria bacterium]
MNKEGGGPGHVSDHRAGRQARLSIQRRGPLAADGRVCPGAAAIGGKSEHAYYAGALHLRAGLGDALNFLT